MSRVAAAASRFSLRARITALAVVGAVVVLPLGVFAIYAGIIDGLDDAVTGELRVRADDVAAEIAAGLPPVLADGALTQVLDGAGRTLVPAGAAPLVDPPPALPATTDGEVVVDRTVEGVGPDARVLVRAVETAGGRRHVVVAGSTRPIERAEQRLRLVLGILGPTVIVGVGAVAWGLTGAALRPVRRMTRRAATLSFEEPSARLPEPPGRDEIAELGQTLNGMLERIERTVAHERAFIDDASHELRTPIAVLRGELELARLELADGADPGACVRALDSALEEADRLARLADHLLVLARADGGRLRDRRRRLGLMTVIADVVDRLDAGDVGLRVSGVDAHVVGDRDLLEQLFVNLVANALRFARHTVAVDVRLDDDVAAVLVNDDGPGFADDVIDRAFERFSRSGTSRTREVGGAGLGLAIAAAIVEAHDGTIEIDNDGMLGGGRVTVRLPRAG